MNSDYLKLLRSEDWSALSSFLLQEAENWFSRGDSQDLQQLLQALPVQYCKQYPWLNYWLGNCLTQSNLVTARQPLEQAFHDFSQEHDLAGQCASCAAIIDVLWLEWDDCSALDPWIDLLAQLRSNAQAQNKTHLLAQLSRSAFAGISIRCPGHPDLPYWEDLSLRQLNKTQFSSDVMLRGLQLMIHYTWGVGDRSHSSLVLETLKTKIGKSDQLDFVRCIYHVVHAAHLHWFAEDAESCENVVKEGLQLSQKLGQPHWDIPLLNCILYKSCALEEVSQAQHWLDILRQRIQLNPRPHDQAIHYNFLAYIAWLKGHPDEALGSAQQAYCIANDSGFAYSPAYYGLGLTAIEVQRGQYHLALKHLAETRRLALGYHSNNMLFMVCMQGAAIAEARGKRNFAIQYLQNALSIGASQRYFAVPWVRLEQLASLCVIALSEGIEIGYVRRLISTFKLKPPADAILSLDHWPWPCRIHVLGQIRIHVTNQEMSAESKASTGLYRLLLHLVAARADGIDVDRLMDRLWPELQVAQAYQRLKTGIHRLRNLLGNSATIIHANRRVCLDTEQVWVDSWALEQCAKDGIERYPELALSIINQYYGTPPSSLCDDQALTYYPSRLEDSYSALIIQVAEQFEADGVWDKALIIWRRGADMLEHERFLSGMVSCLRMLGRHTEASRTMKKYHAEYGEQVE